MAKTDSQAPIAVEPTAEVQATPEVQADPVQTVKMLRLDPVQHGPNEADVHPDEVNNWTAAGWRVAE